MANPIEATPTLCGEDAKEFLKDLKNTRLDEKAIADLERCERLYLDFQRRLKKSHLPLTKSVYCGIMV